MAGKLYGSRLMDGYVSAVGTQHSLKAAQEVVDHDHVGLCAAAEKLYLGIGAVAQGAYLLACRLADGVGAVAWHLAILHLLHTLQYERMANIHIVAVKM